MRCAKWVSNTGEATKKRNTTRPSIDFWTPVGDSTQWMRERSDNLRAVKGRTATTRRQFGMAPAEVRR